MLFQPLKKPLLISFVLLAAVLRGSAQIPQYQISGLTPVFAGTNYGPYTINITGGTWSTADHWCVTGGALNNTSNTCMPNQNSPSISVTWSGSGGTLSYYVGSSGTPAASFTVSAYSINNNIITNPNAEFSPDNYPFVPLNQYYTLNLLGTDASIPGGTINYWYEESMNGSNYTLLPNSATQNYLFDQTYLQSTWVRRGVTANLSGTFQTNYSTPIAIQTAPPVTAGTISPSYTVIRKGNDPGIITALAATGGTMCGIGQGGSYTYTWQTSTDNLTWTNGTGSGLTFDPGILSTKTYIRQLANCGPMTGISATAVVDMYQSLNAGLISPGNLTIPSGTSPGMLTGNPASGGNTSQPYTYQWQYTSDPLFLTGISSLPPSVSALDYMPGSLTAATYFRRAVTCDGVTAYSNTATVQVGAYSSSNYIRSRVITAGNITTPDQATVLYLLGDVKQTTDYFDGLGRPAQTVLLEGSLVTNAAPTDLVMLHEYDPVGREPLQHLPYVSATNDGGIKGNAWVEQNAYNNTQFPNETYNYGQINFEASDLGRINSMTPPGNNWTGSNRGIQEGYGSNTASDQVIAWYVTNSTSVGTFGTYYTIGYYPVGVLFKKITQDEQGNQVIEFTDKSGKEILKKVQLTATPDNGGGKDHSGWLCTYYIYDNLQNLRCVIQPHGVELLIQNGWNLAALNGDILNEQCFRYEYDQRNRMIMKKMPGATEVYMVYDGLDRMVATQDVNLRSANKWLMTLYDILDRPIETAIFASGTSFSSTISWAASSPVFPYAQSSQPPYPTNEILTQTHYDDYTSLPSGLSGTLNTSSITMTNFYSTYNTSPTYAQPIAQITPSTTISTKGLVTWTQAEVLGSGATQNISTSNLYDNRGRVIQQQTINYRQGLDITTIQYDFSGKPLITDLRHQKNATPVQTYEIATRNSYDDLGRQVKTEKMLITGLIPMPAWKTISTMAYDALGRLATKTVGNNIAGTAPLETVAYEYNIRGWLLGANRNFINSSTLPATNFFGFELGYDKVGAIVPGSTYAHQQYNGNIEGEIWKNSGDDAVRKYDFSYDAANRLMNADFNQYNTAFNKNDGLDFSVKMGDGSNPNTAYDANGNIQAMQQTGWKASGSTPIDILSYNYFSHSNRLMNVQDPASDATTSLGDFRYSTTYTNSLTLAHNLPKAATTVDYGYDNNGNLTSDLNKDISSITYNFLNLPQVVTLAKGTITYTYDALGNKLAKVVYEPSANVSSIPTTATTTTTYIAGFVYETKIYGTSTLNLQQYTDNLQYLRQEEGRVRGLYTNPAAPYTLNGFAFDYLLKDHLGNTRVTLTEEPETDPYPTLSFEGTTSSDVANQNAAWDNNVGGPIDVLNNRTAVPAPFAGSSNTSWCRSITKSVTGGIGAAKMIKVMAGDSLNVSIDYTYTVGTPDNSGANGLNTLVNSLANMILGSSDVTAALKSQAATISANTSNNNSVISFFSPETSGGGSVPPKAYLHILLFNNQFVFDNVHSLVMPILSSALNAKQSFTPIVPILKSGYAYIYFSNESFTPVYFDNFALTDIRGPLLETNDYYPFGLTMAGISDKALKTQYAQNKYRFNGGNELQNQEFSDGSGLELYDATHRMYDPQIGRFWRIDRFAEITHSFSPYAFVLDNPILFNDPLGDTTTLPTVYVYAAKKGSLSDELNHLDFGGIDAWVGMMMSRYHHSAAAIDKWAMANKSLDHDRMLWILNGTTEGSVKYRKSMSDSWKAQGKLYKFFLMSAATAAGGEVVGALSEGGEGAEGAEAGAEGVDASITSADDILNDVTLDGKVLKNGELQGEIEGNAADIESNVAKDATQVGKGQYKLDDGTTVKFYESTKGGGQSMQVNSGGTIYKIRIK